MRDELVDFLERTDVEEQIDAFAGGQLARLVVAAQAIFPAALLRTPFEVF
jgi:hypothetical protein